MAAAQELPLLKVLLHAAKHPHSAVNGVLLGTVSSSGVEVKDAIPLFHTSTALAMPTEVALAQISAYTQLPEAKGMQLVGYYHSESRLQAGDLGPTGRRVADRIQDRQPAAVVLVLDNKKLDEFTSSKDVCPFHLFTKDGARGWKREPPERLHVHGGLTWPALNDRFLSLFMQQQHSLMVDFDDHLDDPEKDYLNPQLGRKFALPGQQL